jgi:glucose/arabinose dehydrogenase
MIAGPDGRLWVAQVAGEENAGQGQVVAVDLASGAQSVLLAGLLKPVGIAVLDGYLWIAARNDLLRAPIEINNQVGAVETVLADLPFNGRSIGTLTVTPQGRLLYETSGVRAGNEAAPGSAMLWELNPAEPTNPTVIASGLKNAYAHVFDPNGRLWITDVADDPVNGVAPPDELNLWAPDADFGWPSCYGVQEPARNYGGDEQSCSQTRGAVALFAPRSTPTSIAVSPWEEDVLLVALWVQGVVMRVPVTPKGDNATGVPEVFLTGLQNPQHLLKMEDGTLLVSDFSQGKIYRVKTIGD